MGLQLLAETPLEALVLRHSAIAGSSLWTWLAVVAAVLGLWRIRSAAAATPGRTKSTLISFRRHVVLSHSHPGSDLPQMEAIPLQTQQQPESEARINPTIAVDDSCRVCFAKKGAVFELRSCLVGEAAEEDDDSSVEEDVTSAVKEEEEEEYCSWNEGRGSAWGFVEDGWKGDLGWYHYQDLSALDGRVVRLWEDEKRVATSPFRRRWPQAAVW